MNGYTSNNNLRTKKKGGLLFGYGNNNNKKKLTKTIKKDKVYMINNSDNVKQSDLTVQNLSSTTFTDNIPKYKIVNSPAFATLILNLHKNHSIISQGGFMTYMDDNLEALSTSQSGILSGLKRKLLTSHSYFLTEYKSTDKAGEIAFSSYLPGNILPIVLKPNEKVMISDKSLLCYTKNLNINTRFRLKGIFVREGIAQTEIENNSNSKGMLWLASYGSYFKKKIKEGEGFKLLSGLYLCCPSDVNYGVSTVGGIFTTFASSQGIMFYFKGPCTVYCQGRSIDSLNDHIGQIVDTKIMLNNLKKRR